MLTALPRDTRSVAKSASERIGSDALFAFAHQVILGSGDDNGSGHAGMWAATGIIGSRFGEGERESFRLEPGCWRLPLACERSVRVRPVRQGLLLSQTSQLLSTPRDEIWFAGRYWQDGNASVVRKSRVAHGARNIHEDL